MTISPLPKTARRTIFRLYQTEMQRYDLLSQQGVDTLAPPSLEKYIHEFHDLIESPIRVLLRISDVSLPLKVPATAIPWSDAFGNTLDTELLAHLPLIYYETYDSATIRSLFWEQLTQQFAKVCIGGLREFASPWNLQFALNSH